MYGDPDPRPSLRARAATALLLGLLSAVVILAPAILAPGAGGQEPEPQSRPQSRPDGERTGGWRLKSEESIYLREHSDNPVDWYPWGPAAFARARAEDKLVYLSVGYASCHWCHVMRRTTFMDERVAAALREHFISIKVDREELPGVDRTYIRALSHLGGGGGWPLSVFLTPEQVPFAGSGRYVVADSFLATIEQIAEDWKAERDKIHELGKLVMSRLAAAREPDATSIELRALLDSGVAGITARYDSVAGGFAGPPRFAPKFPAPREAVLLASRGLLEGQPELVDMAVTTLRRMATGALRDPLSGSFHRYTIDREWRVPHFEKMLYTQGLLAEAYLELYRMTGHPDLAAVARTTLDALIAEFALDTGGFAGSYDAESDGHDGRYYMWSQQEVTAAAGKQLAPLLFAYLGIQFEGSHDGQRSIPRVARSIDALAAELTFEVEELQAFLDDGLARLARARAARPAPRRDDKIILGWNSTVVSALARGGVLLADERYLRAATRTHALVSRELVRDDALLRRVDRGEARYPATLQDMALYLRATLDLYEATLDVAHATRARAVAARILREFGTEGGGCSFQQAGTELLGGRHLEFADGALPSGNGLLAHALLRLGLLTGEASYREQADAILAVGARHVASAPEKATELLLAILLRHSRAPEIAVTGPREDPLTQRLLRIARQSPAPFRVVAHRPPGEEGVMAARQLGLLSGRESAEGPKAYLCFDGECRAPTADPEQLASELARAWQPGKNGDRTRKPEDDRTP